MYPLRVIIVQMICSSGSSFRFLPWGRPAFLCNPIFHGAESHPLRSERTVKFKNFAEAFAFVEKGRSWRNKAVPKLNLPVQ